MILVILYEELSEYFLSCVLEFKKRNNADVHIFRKNINQEAPFSFTNINYFTVYNREEYGYKSIRSVINSIHPDAIFCCGWAFSPYLKVAKYYRQQMPVILGFDNQWHNTLQQRICSYLAAPFFRKRFSSCWVPGTKQKIFAEKLGFNNGSCYLNAYSADYHFYYSIFQLLANFKSESSPKRFIYVGRYYDFKGIEDLWKAFIELQNESPNEWELWCLGTGSIQPIEHPKIKHFGFVQPKDMAKFIAETSVFILPSRFEPWGVVVHEFAAAGFPLICSNEVGATEVFLEEGKNGFLFQSGNISQLKECMKKIVSMSNKELLAMGNHSTSLAGKITPEQWADTLMSIIKSGVK